jgi:ribosome-binding ATPase
MVLQLGLVGLPNVGKSTLFNALTRAGANVANYPFTTIAPNVGIAAVPDSRLQRIVELIKPQRVVPATLRVVDIAGLVKGASHGEGLGNQFLAHIRTVDAIAMVVRCFQDEDVPHVTPYLNPVEDLETIELELMLADLGVIEKHLEQVKTRAKGHPRDFESEIAACELARDALQTGRSVRQLDLTELQREALRQVALLTTKPCFYVANVSEKDLPGGGELAQQVCSRAARLEADAIVICARLESELTEWEAADAVAYLAELGVKASGLEQFIRTGYHLLDYVTFFTTTGGHEVRAWTLRRGQTALQAAGAIHTDMERGFIRAEVVSYDDLAATGSLVRAREMGRLRLEGRDYVVQDGDVIHIRFAV